MIFTAKSPRTQGFLYGRKNRMGSTHTLAKVSLAKPHFREVFRKAMCHSKETLRKDFGKVPLILLAVSNSEERIEWIKYEWDCSSEYKTGDAGQDRAEEGPGLGEADRGGGQGPSDEFADASARDQGAVGGWAGGEGEGNSGFISGKHLSCKARLPHRRRDTGGSQ